MVAVGIIIMGSIIIQGVTKTRTGHGHGHGCSRDAIIALHCRMDHGALTMTSPGLGFSRNALLRPVNNDHAWL